CLCTCLKLAGRKVGDDLLGKLCGGRGVTKRPDHRHAGNTSGSKVSDVVRLDITDGDNWQLRKFHQVGIAFKADRCAAGVFGGRRAKWSSADVIDDVRILIGLPDELGCSGG